jgi:hypothetical protein
MAADDIHLHHYHAFCLFIYTNTRYAANGSCTPVLKIVARLPDHSAAGILYGHPFSGRIITYCKNELRSSTLGLGNQRLCICNKHSSGHFGSCRNGIYVGYVVCGISLLPALICTGKMEVTSGPANKTRQKMV